VAGEGEEVKVDMSCVRSEARRCCGRCIRSVVVANPNPSLLVTGRTYLSGGLKTFPSLRLTDVIRLRIVEEESRVEGSEEDIGVVGSQEAKRARGLANKPLTHALGTGGFAQNKQHLLLGMNTQTSHLIHTINSLEFERP
jgi:hypothetical protein